VGREPRREGEEGLEPRALALAKEVHILEACPTGQEGAQGNDQDSEQEMPLRLLDTGGLSGADMLDDGRVHGVSHGPGSSPEVSVVRSITEVALQGWKYHEDDAITLAPLATSRYTLIAPATVSAATCASTLWPS
jgi:hypothetical protein